MRYLSMVWLLSGFLLAMGGQPKPEVVKVVTPNITPVEQQDTVAASPKEQFNKAYGFYESARNSTHRTYADQAIHNFNLYLDNFPTDEKHYDALYLLSSAYGLIGETDKQAKTLMQYQQETPTDNFFIKYAELDQALISYRQGTTTNVKEQLDAWYDKYATSNIRTKNDFYETALPAYEDLGDTARLKEIYGFYIKNKDFLANPDLYYVYAYKLAVIYYNSGDKVQAAKYFNIVMQGKDRPMVKYYAESAAGYLAGLPKVK